MLLSFLNSLGPAVGNHLWQSTVFVAVVWAVALALRRNSARVRYGLWLAASVKFLVPFSLLIGLGGLLPRPSRVVVAPVYSAVDSVGQPFSEVTGPMVLPVAQVVSLRERLVAELPIVVAGVWVCGVVTVLLVWLVRWRRVAAAMRRAVRVESGREFEILRRVDVRGDVCLRLSRELMEPGVFGVWRPVLIWPEQLLLRLQDEHIAAIVAHELMHVRRRDNLAAMLHMVVEAAFWFHPMVWWMERRMVEERERACDEAVVELGAEAGVYAESLLKTVRFCVESPLVCVSGITGADLSRRVRSIMTLRLEMLSFSRKILLTSIGFMTVVGPVAFGVVRMIPMYGQILHASGPLPSFEVATIKPFKPSQSETRTSPPAPSLDSIDITVTTRMLIQTAYNLPIGSKNQITGGPGWIDTDMYEVHAKIEQSMAEAMQKLPGAQRREKTQLMMQSLLADRLKFKMHFETREMPVYGLVVAKGGPKLIPARGRTEIDVAPKGLGLTVTAKAATLDDLVYSPLFWMVKELGGRTVVNQTGLSGTYDFGMHWMPERPATQGVEGAPLPDVDATSFSTALEEQLGLRLVSTKGPVEVIVIDHIERPVPQDQAGLIGPRYSPMPLPSAIVPLPKAGLRPVAFVQASAAPSPAAQVDATPAELRAFEVISIRPSTPGNTFSKGGFTPEGYSAENMSLAAILAMAYRMWNATDDHYAGVPDWAKTQAWDIEAKVNPADMAEWQALTNRQREVALQALLADRFKLSVHREPKEFPIYALVIAKSGPKLKEAKAGDTYPNGIKKKDGSAAGASICDTKRGLLSCQAMSMNVLSQLLSQTKGIGRIVEDKTGLSGSYDFALQWTPDTGPAVTSSDAAPPESSGPSIFTALQEQLGLRLDSQKELQDSLVIDHVERPSAN